MGARAGSDARITLAELSANPCPPPQGLASDEYANVLVGGEPHEPIDAACAGQPLELVLASVF